MKFTQLSKSLQEQLYPIYLVEGEESYFSEHAVKSIQKACRLTQPLLNDVREEGETLKGDKLIAFRDSLYTLPFLDEKRLVRVYNFFPTEKEWETLFKSYALAPCPSTVLVIVNVGKKANAADLKKKSGVTLVDCSRADEETLTKWLFTLMRREGLLPDSDAVSTMVRYSALNAARLRTETEKLKMLLGEGGRVTREVVEEHIERDVEYKIYELTQAASRGDFTQFSEILNDLMKKGYDESAALSSLTAHYKTLSQIAQMRGSDEEIGEVLGIKAYAVKKNRELLKRMGGDCATRRYLELYALLCGLRSGQYLKTGALLAGISKIFFD